MAGIATDVRDIVAELDVDGGGYQTGEAASLLVHRYIQAGICLPTGEPKPKVRSLMRLGAGVAFKGYKGTARENNKRKNQAAAALIAAGGQRDFGEIDEDFGFAWLLSYAALDEGEAASRKMLMRMTLPDVVSVIALKRKKANEADAEADRLQDIVDAHPYWADQPSLTLADILNIQDERDRTRLAG